MRMPEPNWDRFTSPPGVFERSQLDHERMAVSGTFKKPVPRLVYTTGLGAAFSGDALDLLRRTPDNSIALVLTSPPFALRRKKEYGNVDQEHYVSWFLEFGHEVHRVLKPDGSFVIDIGGSWNIGRPTRSLYHFELVVSLCRDAGFHLAQEFFWYNPSKLPSPAEWVNVRRLRVKDAVNCIWWLSKDPFPKADNRRVLREYSQSMKDLLRKGYVAKRRPSGWDISKKFSRDNKGAIPANLLSYANTDSNSRYLTLCRENGLRPHPARFPAQLPAFFIDFLTDGPSDIVLDIFAGSNVTGRVAENKNRRWLAFELIEEYLRASEFRWPEGGVKEEMTRLFGQTTDSVPRANPARGEAEPLLRAPSLGVSKPASPRATNG
jgi:DNA modification methylase